MTLIIAVSYGGSQDIPAYVRSLQRQDESNWRLIVVNNSDDPFEARELREATSLDKRVTLLEPGENLGYFGAVRWALKRAKSHPRWLIISNTDVQLVSTDSLSILEEIDRESEVPPAVVAPSIVSRRTGLDQNPFLERRPGLASHRRRRIMLGIPTVAQVAMLGSAARARLSGMRRNRPSEVARRNIYAPHGSFMAIHDSYFLRGGDLEYPLFLFGEENYVAEQSWRAGLHVLYVPEIVVEHVEHQQIGLLRARHLLRLSGRAAKYTYDAYLAAGYGNAKEGGDHFDHIPRNTRRDESV
jgi:GT2 family glycosyltransferase